MIPAVYDIKKVYKGTVDELQNELSELTLENIKNYKAYRLRWDDFYSMWLRFGPDAARTQLIPYVWDGRIPSPKEAMNGT